MAADRFCKKFAELRDVVRFAERFLRQRVIQVPVASDLWLDILRGKVEAKMMPWQKLVHILVESFVCREITKREELGKGTPIEPRFEVPQFEERLDFRDKGESIACNCIVEGFDP